MIVCDIYLCVASLSDFLLTDGGISRDDSENVNYFNYFMVAKNISSSMLDTKASQPLLPDLRYISSKVESSQIKAGQDQSSDFKSC